jgi:hypothetical protein
VVSRSEVYDTIAHLLHNGGALVPHDRRWLDGCVPVQQVQVRPTDTRTDHADDRLPLLGRLDLDIFESWTQLRVP